jgi:Helix-hairpin-helix motif
MNNIISKNIHFVKICFVGIGVFVFCGVTAQEPARRQIDLNTFVQNLLPPVQTDALNYNDLYESLLQLYTSPLDLNICTRDELAGLYILSERQINGFLAHREQYGKLLSLYELQAVTDFDVVTIQKLLPFVTLSIGNGSLWSTLSNPSENYLILRAERLLETKRGFTDGAPKSRDGTLQRYQGSPIQWYARYRYRRSNQFSFGFTMEKDEGEAFDWNPSIKKYGTDYLSFHAQVQNRGRLKNLIVGDYQLQIGQGLIFSSGFVLGKGGETVLTVRRPTSGARPYTSVTEGGFFRGSTATVSLAKSLELTALYSRVFRDGSATAEDDGSSTISSILSSGLRRTPNELSKRGNLLEQNVGAHLLYRLPRGQIGLTTLHTTFNKSLLKKDADYNAYEFAGASNTLWGIHGNYQWGNKQVFGEVARSSGGGIGAIGGMLWSLSKRWDASLLLRNYTRDYHSFFANAFGENTRNSNEAGVYVGAKYTVHKKLTAGAYIDTYKFPWFKYLVDKKPTSGFDYLLQTTWTPTKKLALYAIYRDEYKEKNVPQRLSKTKIIATTNRRNLIFNAEYAFSKVLSWRTRVQGGTYTYEGFPTSKGWLVLQELNADWGKFSINTRLSAYNSDDYDSRQYAPERDVLYVVSMLAYYERGFRNYVLLQYTPTKHLDLWFKISRTDQPDRQKLGSSGDEIATNHRTDLRLQARWRF